MENMNGEREAGDRRNECHIVARKVLDLTLNTTNWTGGAVTFLAPPTIY